MPYSCKVGDSFYLKTDNSNISHRHVIITSRNNGGNVVLVNFTSFHIKKECCVIFYPKDCRDLFEHSTTIAYGRAQLLFGDGLSKFANNNYRYCESHIVNEIIKGAFLSSELAPYILEEIKRQYPEIYQKRRT
jgi:hypothetical protein